MVSVMPIRSNLAHGETDVPTDGTTDKPVSTKWNQRGQEGRDKCTAERGGDMNCMNSSSKLNDNTGEAHVNAKCCPLPFLFWDVWTLIAVRS